VVEPETLAAAEPLASDTPMTVFWYNGRPVGHVLRMPTGEIVRSMVKDLSKAATPPIAATMPATSVVICTRDRPDELRRCLESLPQQTYPIAEIIVVDNASKDLRTRDVALEAGVVYVREDRPGLDVARNTGARRATGSIIAYTDDDVLLYPTWLERLVAAFDDPAIGAVTGLVLPAELATEAQLHFESYWSFSRGYDRRDFTPAYFTEFRAMYTTVFPAWEVGAGASMAFRRGVFGRAGYFDERLDVGQAGCSGDSEYWYRLLAKGYICRYEPASVAFHYHRRDMQGLGRQIFQYMRGHSASLMVQHQRTGLESNLRQQLLGKALWYAERIFKRLTHRRLPEDIFLRQEVMGYISGLIFFLRHRREYPEGDHSFIDRREHPERDPPLISVVIPGHNAELTLRETLDSLLAQTEFRWEALIVNDGSIDGTAAIIDAYIARDARFAGVAGPGKGAAAARNAGLSAARGKWLHFLDADDWIDPFFFEKLLAAVESTPGAVASYCGYCRVMPDGRLTPERNTHKPAEDALESFARSCAVAIHTVLIDRETVLRLGGFDTALTTCEDWDLWQRVARFGQSWVQVPQTLAYYRASTTSLSRNMQTMLADSRVVITRGFSTDNRLAAFSAELTPACAAGASEADGQTASLAYAWFALWCAVQEIGCGGPGGIDAALLAPLPKTLDGTDSIVDVIFDALMVGSRSIAKQLAAKWPEYGARLTSLIVQLGEVWGEPSAARRLQYHLEQRILDYDDLAETRPLGLTLGLRIDIFDPPTLQLPPGIDRIYAYLIAPEKRAGNLVAVVVQFGALGTVTREQWIELICSPPRPEFAAYSQHLEKIHRATPKSRLYYDTAAKIVRHPGLLLQRTAFNKSKASPNGNSPLSFARTTEPPGSHAAGLRKVKAMAAEQAAQAAPVSPVIVSGKRTEEPERAGDRQAFFEDIFAVENPWNYESAYEQQKYELQLAMLPAEPIGQALELACAEGHFTVQLAPRVGRLLATDISSKALERARARSKGLNNVDFQVLDFSANPIPQGMDLIVCSEVLYYLADEAELRRVAQHIAASLRAGGSLVVAHAFTLTDNMNRTGFDWQNPYGAETITRVFGETPGLALERSLETELYRIDRFRRIIDGLKPDQPTVEPVPIVNTLETEVARQIVWGGATARRSDVARTEQRPHVPVLMYHGVTSEGPEALARYRISPAMFQAQIRWLRAKGFHAIGSAQLNWFLQNNHPFVGRPVMVTFDDGMQNFADNAWPILRANDFTSEMFIVTGRVGQAAIWDADIGPPAPLMSAATIAGLAAEGVLFGSHLATHRAADSLSTLELAEELAGSHAMLDKWLGAPPISLALPFSIPDVRLRSLAAETGYSIVFGSKTGLARLGDDPLDLPRMEVRGDRTLDDFIQMMEAGL
jgi:glycosyltransferase involved in cell wall biosynthesis/peptidoglycan/xylan/chitin deacetylase (PgdA/CDA1 family)